MEITGLEPVSYICHLLSIRQIERIFASRLVAKSSAVHGPATQQRSQNHAIPNINITHY